MNKSNIAVIVPNWNGKDSIANCLDSLKVQSIKPMIIVIDNGSVDGSVDLIKQKYPDVNLLSQSRNLGFAGGVNVGVKRAMSEGIELIGLLNNDAIVDGRWLESLVNILQADKKLGIVTSKLIDSEKRYLDSTGDFYTTWGLPYPRGRGEAVSSKYDADTDVFAASGGASLYRAEMLKEIGLFDEDFFAYYEDVDLSFRAQLAGWKVAYVPEAIVYHQIGATSSKIKGFTTYQTMKNLPMIVRRDVPLRLLPTVLPRFWLAYTSFYFSAVARGQFWPATKGWFVALVSLPKNLIERRQIQKNRKVSVEYIYNMLVHDLPPNAARLRALRQKWWKLTSRVK